MLKQHDEKDCGVVCLSIICQKYGLHKSLQELRELSGTDINGTTVYGMVFAAQKLGFNARALSGSLDDFYAALNSGEIKLPTVCLTLINGLQHFIIINEISTKGLVVYDPARGKSKISPNEFNQIWLDTAIDINPSGSFIPNKKTYGEYQKFLQIIRSQAKLFGTVLFISIVLSLIGLICSFIYEYAINSILNVNTVSAQELAYNNSGMDTIINHFLPSNDFATRIAYVSIAVLLFYLVYACLNILRGLFFSKLSKKIDLELVLAYYTHIIDLPIKVYASRKTGELLSRINDTTKVRDAISNATLSVISDLVQVVTFGVILFKLSFNLSLIVFSILLVFIIVFLIFREPVRKYNELSMENNAQLTAFVKESLDGIETVKVTNSQKSIKAQNDIIFNKTLESVYKGSIIQNTHFTITELLVSVCAVLVLWRGVIEVVNSALSLGTLITYVSISTFLFEPIKHLIDLQPTLQSAVVAADRLNDLLEIEIEKENGLAFFNGDIIIKNLSFEYKFGISTINNANLSISKGSCVGIVGESGSGKTTLAKLLLGFYDSYEGSICIAGQEVSKIDKHALRSHVGYISQDMFFFTDSIANNIRLGSLQISDEEIQNVCALCYLDEFIKSLPFGYNTILEERGANLSYGQKQRLAIARALARKPDILIFDEATSNLDIIASSNIERIIKNLKTAGVTCVIIAHRLQMIKNCDRIYVLEKGHIIEEGTHLELINKQGLYYSFWECDTERQNVTTSR